MFETKQDLNVFENDAKDNENKTKRRQAFLRINASYVYI